MQTLLTIDDTQSFASVFKKAMDFNATDIFILEGKPPRLGRLKIYAPIQGASAVSRGDIENLIRNTRPTSAKDTSDPSKLTKLEYAFSIDGFGRYRVSSTESEEGIGLSIRKLPYYIPKLEEIDKRGFLKGLQYVFEGKETQGLILHTGITGSGKSTSIASEVNMIAQNISGNILTFENPIEYHYLHTKAGIRQFEVGPHVDSFIEGMQLAVRNDASVIVIGEVRTNEEIQTMVDIAIHGHVVFASLHTRTAMETLRLLDSARTSKRILEAVVVMYFNGDCISKAPISQ